MCCDMLGLLILEKFNLFANLVNYNTRMLESPEGAFDMALYLCFPPFFQCCLWLLSDIS